MLETYGCCRDLDLGSGVVSCGI